MKTLYLDCSMGAAGDMLTAALLELTPDPEAALAELNGIGVPKVTYEKERAVRCGLAGTHMIVRVDGEVEGETCARDLCAHSHECDHVHSHEHDCDSHKHDRDSHEHDHSHEHGHHHAAMQEIEGIVRGRLNLPAPVADKVMEVYGCIAAAESRAHGVPVSEVHFHEVGALDAVADVAAFCLLLHRLAPDRVVVSPVNVGGGQVRCAHGLLPVPAPATALILQGAKIPSFGTQGAGELCTPTGAALLAAFGGAFGPQPAMCIQKIGYGMGTRDFADRANCVRAMLGESEGAAQEILELSCNMDDMTGEAMGYAMERLFAAGALDVYTVPVGMKKSRPGTMLCVLCEPADREKLVRELFAHTTTLGVRENRLQRYKLARRCDSVEVDGARVRRKVSTGYGVRRAKYEYEDLAAVAADKGLPLESVRALAEQAQGEA